MYPVKLLVLLFLFHHAFSSEYAQILDVHHHHFTEEAARVYDNLPSRVFGPAPVNASMHYQWMDSNEVRTAVLSYPLTNFGTNYNIANIAALLRNSTISQYQLVLNNPLRFGSLASLPIPHINETLVAIDYALSLPIPADGFEVSSNTGGIYIGDPSLAPIWSRFNQLNATVFVHPATPVPYPPTGVSPEKYEWMFDTTRAIYNLFQSRAFVFYPNIKWLFAHTGGTFPYISDRLSKWLTPLSADNPAYGLNSTEVVRILGNRTYQEIIASLWWDTSIATRAHYYELEDMGADFDKVVVGSDFPYKQTVTNASIAAYNNENKINKIRFKNALDLFPRLKKQYRLAGLI